MLDEFADPVLDEVYNNLDPDAQVLISRAQQSSGPPSKQVSTLTARIHMLEEQVLLDVLMNAQLMRNVVMFCIIMNAQREMAKIVERRKKRKYFEILCEWCMYEYFLCIIDVLSLILILLLLLLLCLLYWSRLSSCYCSC